jgi:hypothetical protein
MISAPPSSGATRLTRMTPTDAPAPEGDLQDFMERSERHFGRDRQSAPDRGLDVDVAERDAEVEEVARGGRERTSRR